MDGAYLYSYASLLNIRFGLCKQLWKDAEGVRGPKVVIVRKFRVLYTYVQSLVGTVGSVFISNI